MVIPNSVTSIGDYVFSGCTSLANVVIPNSVTSIGDGAFSGCTSLASIEIPSGVTSIGDYAFSDCTSLASIEIPSSVTSIGRGVFACCINLENIRVNKDNTAYKSVDGILFSNDEKMLIQYPCGNKRTSYTIPSSVTSIGDHAFDGCNSLANVVIPNSVTSIGIFAFEDCTSLASIEIPSGVTSIGDYAFSDCTSLASIEIPSSVTYIGARAFSGCESITSIEIPSGVTSIGDHAFSGCESLSNVVIPNSVTSIGDWAFSGCTSLASIEIPNGVISIKSGAFSNCTSLVSIEIPSSVTYIGWRIFNDGNVFDGCNALKTIYYTGTYEEWKTLLGNNVDFNDFINNQGGLKVITNYKGEKAGGEATASDDGKNQIILTINSKEISVFGDIIYNDVPPIIRNDRTMLPARFIAEQLGAAVNWDEGEKKVEIRKDNQVILIYIDSSHAKVNDKDVELDSPAFIENDRTYLPVRFLTESLGATVEWDALTQKVYITK